MPFGTILPQEPDWQDSDAEIQQKLESERAGALIEEFIGGFEFEEESPARIQSEEQAAQLQLGAPNAPILMNATIRLPANVSPEAAARELGPLVERQMRMSMADSIAEDDYDEFAYIPLALFTQKEKEKKGLPKPKTPLYGSGELVKQMAPGGWLSDYEWKDETLTIAWGPNDQDDRKPSDKYKNMFYGSPGVGKGHKVKIPRRFPRLSTNALRETQDLVNDWLRLKQDESALTLANSSSPLWTE